MVILVIYPGFYCYNQVGLGVVWHFDKYIILLKNQCMC
jgi:sRNA-binding regulator protein Hfq